MFTQKGLTNKTFFLPPITYKKSRYGKRYKKKYIYKSRLRQKQLSHFFLRYILKHIKKTKVFKEYNMLYFYYFKLFIKYIITPGFFNYNMNFYSSPRHLAYKVNYLIGHFGIGPGLGKYYLLKYRPYLIGRHIIDHKLKKRLYKDRNKKKYKNFFFIKKFNLKRLRTIWVDYKYLRQWRPYSLVRKKHKIFFNLGDRHYFKRLPIYRYKFPLLYSFPRFSHYKKLYKTQLREQHIFRWLYRLRFSQLLNYFRKSTSNTKYGFNLIFLKYFEWRLDTIIYRLNFAFSIKHARQLINRGFFTVNNKIINHYTHPVKLGDVIMPITRLRTIKHGKRFSKIKDRGLIFMNLRLFYRPIQMDQYPDYLLINERIPAGLIIKNINPLELRYIRPFSLQYLTYSFLKYM